MGTQRVYSFKSPGSPGGVMCGRWCEMLYSYTMTGDVRCYIYISWQVMWDAIYMSWHVMWDVIFIYHDRWCEMLYLYIMTGDVRCYIYVMTRDVRCYIYISWQVMWDVIFIYHDRWCEMLYICHDTWCEMLYLYIMTRDVRCYIYISWQVMWDVIFIYLHSIRCFPSLRNEKGHCCYNFITTISHVISSEGIHGTEKYVWSGLLLLLKIPEIHLDSHFKVSEWT